MGTDAGGVAPHQRAGKEPDVRIRDRLACLMGSHDFEKVRVLYPEYPCTEADVCRRCSHRSPSYTSHWGDWVAMDACSQKRRCTHCGETEYSTRHGRLTSAEQPFLPGNTVWGNQVPAEFRKRHPAAATLHMGPCDRVVRCGTCGYVTAMTRDYHHGTGSRCTVCGEKNSP